MIFTAPWSNDARSRGSVTRDVIIWVSIFVDMLFSEVGIWLIPYVNDEIFCSVAEGRN
ncbi:hypothetical protein [Nonomuraea sp. NPDC049784]|uniref:hypothetical protein n=1 Tax=Nonomuraea sp. NPDC049784 TaxID=3154361 RepID=UPI0033E94433